MYIYIYVFALRTRCESTQSGEPQRAGGGDKGNVSLIPFRDITMIIHHFINPPFWFTQHFLSLVTSHQVHVDARHMARPGG